MMATHCETLSWQTCQQTTAVGQVASVALTRSVWWRKRAEAKALGVCGGTGVRWVRVPLLLQCYDRPNEIYGGLGFSFCSITHPLSFTWNPLWICPQTLPLGRMDAFADVPDTRAFWYFFYGLHKHTRVNLQSPFCCRKRERRERSISTVHYDNVSLICVQENNLSIVFSI